MLKLVGVFGVLSMLLGAGAAEAQQIPFSQRPFSETTIRPTGQPVIPIYDGWYANDDGTATICFGYFNLNTEQAFDIPLGAANHIAPAEYDGGQPTRFDPVPDPSLTNKFRHHWCVFTVQVPADFGDQRIVWTLNTQGEDLSVPGHLLPAYVLEERSSPGRGGDAPRIRLAEAEPQAYGRNGLVAERTVAVDEPLELPVWVEHPEPGTWLGWTKHQGEGDVSFTAAEVIVADAIGRGTTAARFAAPGEYLLRVQAINDPGPRNPTYGFEFHCCWTNAYVRVTVTP